MATLACWSLVYLNIHHHKPFEIVITHGSVDYLLPVTSDFQVLCERPESQNWNRFLTSLQRKGKGRVQVQAAIYQDEKLAVAYQGTFAALEAIFKS